MVTSPAHRTKDQSRTVDTDKDHVISSLREKCQEFSRLVSSHQNVLVRVADVSTHLPVLLRVLLLLSLLFLDAAGEKIATKNMHDCYDYIPIWRAIDRRNGTVISLISLVIPSPSLQICRR